MEEVIPKPLEEVAINKFSGWGLEDLTLKQMELIKEGFVGHLEAARKGRRQSLKVIPTELPQVDHEKLPEGKALVVEVGGTNLRAVIVENKNGQLNIIGDPIRHKFTKREKSSLDVKEFFGLLAEKIEPLQDDLDQVQALGVIYSFSGNAQKVEQGVDVQSDKGLSKGWKIEGIEDVLVGESLTLAIKKRYGVDLSEKSLAVMNDTPATLYALPGAKIGGVVATGFNIALIYEQMARNLEAGGFNFAPEREDWQVFETRLSYLADLHSPNPGQYLAEKQIAAGSLENQFKIAIQELIKEGLLSQRLAVKELDQFKGEFFSQILSDEWKHVEKFFGTLLREGEKEVMKELVGRLINRSTQILASLFTACADYLGIEEGEVEMPIDGDFFFKVPDYIKKVNEVIQKLNPQLNFKFPKIENPGIIGAAAVALAVGEKEQWVSSFTKQFS